ncbi:prolyl 3-hydroxylase 3 [Hyla sarda]|uniref:prolyl 3-hydroxylase 3 n=1 Tax=Hyla sarda TaxID=327740 RepID=UPI0024C31318|nr:prolyl 3-hydroxylase 3 [Hyla sarda]
MQTALLLLSLGLTCSLTLQPPDELLWDGVSLFSKGEWSEARDKLWGALRSLQEVRGVRLRCGEQCGLPGAQLEEAVMGRAECLLSCERLQLGEPSLYRLTQDTEKTFHRGAPYNYLQVAHYRLEELDEAAAAAYTFYVRNPHHEQIQGDVTRYRTMKGVQEQSFRDLEEPPYKALFSQAESLLSQAKHTTAVLRLEESLSSCLSTLHDCRTLCEGTRERENETQRDFPEVIADYYTQILQCKQQCILEVSLSLGQKRSQQDILISHLQLLQEGYSQLGDWESAARVARSLLLFQPHNETVLKSLRGYEEKLPGKSEIRPRANIASYVRQVLSEKKLLYYVMENLGIDFQDPDLWTPEEIIPEIFRERVRAERTATEEAGGQLPYEEVTVTLTPRQMNGTSRVTMDGVLTDEECEALLGLVQEAEASGEAFKRRRSPYTSHERIQGLTVLQALQMISSELVDRNRAHFLYHATERTRILAQSYFETKTLHFSYSQLVCWSAVEGEQEERSDLSHPVHADNCVLDPEEKKCWREPPAYIHRDYSGLLYLNDDFLGGDIFFTELDGTTVTAEVRPRCGRLVLFSSGGENAYGVHALTQGRSCAITLSFTGSAEHAEQERLQAKRIVTGEVSKTEETESKNSRNGREVSRTGTSGNEENEKPTGRQQRRRVSRNIRDEL